MLPCATVLEISTRWGTANDARGAENRRGDDAADGAADFDGGQAAAGALAGADAPARPASKYALAAVNGAGSAADWASGAADAARTFGAHGNNTAEHRSAALRGGAGAGDACFGDTADAAVGQFLSAPERQIAAADSAGEWCLQLLALAVLPAVLEEALFRGVVLQTLLDSGSRFGAWLLTTLFFSLLHGNLAALPAHLLFGGALTLAEMRTGNLLVPMVMHAVYNASALFWRGMSSWWLIFCGAAVLALGIWALMTLPRTAKMRMKRGHIMLSAAILLLMAVQYLL